MKKIFNSKKIILALAFLSSLGLLFSVIFPVLAGVKQGMDLHANCINTVFPPESEQRVFYDVDEGIIQVTYYENGVSKDVNFSLKKDPKISECSESAREIIELVRSDDKKMRDDTCIEFKNILAGNEPLPEMDGKKMNAKNMEKYISKRCD